MTEALPPPLYVTRFNSRAINNGTTCAIEASQELNATLKLPVTAALRKVMSVRPDQPVQYLAQCLKKDNEAKYVIDRKTLVLEDYKNIEIQLVRASQRPAGCVVHRFPEYQITGMQCPSFQELQQEIERVAAALPSSSSNSIAVVVKENDPRQDLVFIQGIPYFADFTAAVRSRSVELKKKDSVASLLLRSAGRLGKAHTIQDITSASKSTKKSVDFTFIPSPMADPFQAIEVMHAKLGLPNSQRAGGGGGGQTTAQAAEGMAPSPPSTPGEEMKLQAVIVVSYHSDESVLRQLLTTAVITSSPIVEVEEMKAVATLRKNSLDARRKQDFNSHEDYWKKVRIGREARDKHREDKEELRLRKEATLLTGITVDAVDPAQAELLKYDGSGTAAALKKAATKRYHRRQREDGQYLDVIRFHRDQSATQIQNMWRGAKSRNMWKAAAAKVGSGGATTAATMANRTDPEPPKGFLQLTNIDAPVLLQRAMRTLQQVHGQGYINSVALVKKGFVRTIPLWVPKKTRLPKELEDDVSSEEESWTRIEVELPNLPSSKRSKDFNPFHIMRKAATLVNYSGLQDAIYDAANFPGLPSFQQRAYNTVMDHVMLMVHAAFVNLRYRGKLTSTTFASYFRKHLSELLAWRDVPHFVALSTVPLSGLPLLAGPTDPLRDRFLCLSDCPQTPPWGLAVALDPPVTAEGGPRWWRKAASRLYAVLDAPDASKLKGIIQTLGQGTNHVTIISTASQPYCYINGKTFVACECRRDQATPFQPFPRHIADIAAIATPSLATPSEPSSRAASTTLSQQGSGTPALMLHRAVTNSQTQYEHTVLGLSMTAFEQSLRAELIHIAETTGTVHYLDIASSSSDAMSMVVPSPASGELADFGTALVYGSYFVEIMQAPALEQKELVLFPRVASISAKHQQEAENDSINKESRRISANMAASNSNAHSVSSTMSKSGRYRRSTSRSEGDIRSGSQNGSNRDLNDGKSPSTTSLIPQDNMREGGGQRTSLAQGIVQTPSAVADLIFQEENSGEGTFLRMPMLEVGGITWLKNLDEFLGRCFLAIKAKEVLAIGVTDESSMFYVCCAALLAPPAEEPGAVSSPMFRSQSDPLDDAVLEKFIGQLGGAPGLRAKAVVDDALSYLFGGDTYVRAISDLKSAAEAARSQKQVRDNILAAYQRLERYCWLIALASFVMGTNLAGISVMPSFASWVTSKKNASVLKALEEVDLWVAEPRKCPDPCHSVYSSVWKRWETKSEAKQMI